MCFTKAKMESVFIVALWLLVFVVWVLMNIRLGHSIPANGSIDLPFSDVSPVIDGKWTSASEWADAQSLQMRNDYNETAYVRLKHNGTCIFALIDFVTDFTSSTFDQGGMCLDSENNGGSLPQPDDYLFAILAGQDPTWVYSYRGTGTGSKPEESWSLIVFPEVVGEAGFSKGQNGEGNDHRIYELQIPCKRWPAASSYGFYVYVFDFHSKTLLEWPVGAGGQWTQTAQSVPSCVPPSPENWGSVMGDFVPEFRPWLMLLALAGATTVISVAFRRARFKGGSRFVPR